MRPHMLKSVSAVEIEIEEKFPPVLKITAGGEAPTSGYTDIRIRPVISIMRPRDGMYEFALMGTPPMVLPEEDAVTHSQSETYIWAEYPKDIKGVRITATENFIEGTIPDEQWTGDYEEDFVLKIERE